MDLEAAHALRCFLHLDMAVALHGSGINDDECWRGSGERDQLAESGEGFHMVARTVGVSAVMYAMDRRLQRELGSNSRSRDHP